MSIYIYRERERERETEEPNHCFQEIALFLRFLVENQTETGYHKLLSSDTEDKDYVCL